MLHGVPAHQSAHCRIRRNYTTIAPWSCQGYPGTPFFQIKPDLLFFLLQGNIFESFWKGSLVPQIHTDVLFSETGKPVVSPLASSLLRNYPLLTMENVKSFWIFQMRKGKGESPITEITFMRVSQDRHLTPLHRMALLCNALNTEKESRWQSKSRRGHQPLESRTMWSLVVMNMKEGIQPQIS